MGTFNFGALPESVIQNAVAAAVAVRTQPQLWLTQIPQQDIDGMLETETGRRRRLLPLVAKSEARLYYLVRRGGGLTESERAEDQALDKWQRRIYDLFSARNTLPEFQQVVLATQRAVEAAEHAADQAAAPTSAALPNMQLTEAQLDYVASRYNGPMFRAMISLDAYVADRTQQWRSAPRDAMEMLVREAIRLRYLRDKTRNAAEAKEFEQLAQYYAANYGIMREVYGVPALAVYTTNQNAAMQKYELLVLEAGVNERLQKKRRQREQAAQAVTPVKNWKQYLPTDQQLDMMAANAGMPQGAWTAAHIEGRVADVLRRDTSAALIVILQRRARAYYLNKNQLRGYTTAEQNDEYASLRRTHDLEFSIVEQAGLARVWQTAMPQLIERIDRRFATPAAAAPAPRPVQESTLRARPEDIRAAWADRQRAMSSADESYGDAEALRARYEDVFEKTPLDALRMAAFVSARFHHLDSMVGATDAERNERRYLGEEARIIRMVAAEAGYSEALRQVQRDLLDLRTAAAAAPAPAASPVTVEQVYNTLKKSAESMSDVDERNKAFRYIDMMLKRSWTSLPSLRYVATMFASKADPFGRHALVDCLTSYGTSAGSTDIRCYLAGAKVRDNMRDKAALLGGGYSESAIREIDGKKYSRSHTPDGVIVEKTGLGFVLYSSHALVGYVLRGAEGCYSYPGGRSESAEEWWSKAVLPRSGRPSYAQRLKDFKVVGGHMTHCEPVRGRVLRNRDLELRPEAGRISEEAKSVCAYVDMEYTIDKSAKDVLTAKAVMDSGFVAFGLCAPQDRTGLPLKSGHLPFWDEKQAMESPDARPVNELRTDIFYKSGRNSVYRRTADGDLTYAMTKTRAELFSVSFHGPSPILAAVILNLLAKKYEDQAVGYVMRPDIAAVLAGNKVLARLVMKRSLALPGLQGLSKAAHREICAALNGIGQTPPVIDMERDNPFNLPKLSAETKAMVAAYSHLD